MLVDALLVLAALGAILTGFRRGFLQTLLSTIGYIGGGVLGLGLGLNLTSKIQSSVNKILLVILAIFVVAEVGRRIFSVIAKFFRTRILWAPLRLVDSTAGALLEFIRVAIFAYLILSIALWSPWAYAKNAIGQSKIYAEIENRMPHVVDRLRSDIENKLRVNPQLQNFSNQLK